MRRRLVTSTMGALLGAVAGPSLSASWELSVGASMLLFAVGGGILGYIASLLFDVFTGDIGTVSDAQPHD